MRIFRKALSYNCQRYLSNNTRNTVPPDFTSSENLLDNAVVSDDKQSTGMQDAWTSPTYHDELNKIERPKRIKVKKYRPSIPILDEDHSENTILLFPGQGCQYVGMGQKAIDKAPATKDLFHRASALLGYDLLNLCLKVICYVNSPSFFNSLKNLLLENNSIFCNYQCYC